MRAHSTKLGYGRMAMIASNSSQSFEDMADSADSYAARATDTEIDNLPKAESSAVNRKLLGARYTHIQDFAQTFDSAVKRLARRLDVKGLC
jgi:hypothetical protein